MVYKMQNHDSLHPMMTSPEVNSCLVGVEGYSVVAVAEDQDLAYNDLIFSMNKVYDKVTHLLHLSP